MMASYFFVVVIVKLFWLIDLCTCVIYRIVCEMGKAERSQFAGNVQVCVGECHPEFMAKSSKYYYFVVSFSANNLQWTAGLSTMILIMSV